MKKKGVIGLLLMTANSVVGVRRSNPIMNLTTVRDVASAPSLFDAASADGNFSTFLAGLQKFEFDALLKGDPGFAVTIFAPTNDAFDNALALEENFEQDYNTWVDFYFSCIVLEKYLLTDLKDGMVLETIGEKNLTVSVNSKDQYFINDVLVVLGNLEASNGVVHGISDVNLFPSAFDVALADGNFSTLVAGFQKFDFHWIFKYSDLPLTLFAPTDGAFALEGNFEQDYYTWFDILTSCTVERKILLTDLNDGDVLETVGGLNLTVSVNSNDQYLINGVPVVLGNLEASNSVIHGIGEVIFAPKISSIIDVASADGNFITFVAAMKLVPELTAELIYIGNYTVFAPTDDAFAAVENLPSKLKDEDWVIDLLETHIVDGKYLLKDLSNEDLRNFRDENLTIAIRCEDEYFVNNAKIVLANLEYPKGVLHGINAIIPLPGSNEIPTPSSKCTQPPSIIPSKSPSPPNLPSKTPSNLPSKTPSNLPSKTPSNLPSKTPSNLPSKTPSDLPSKIPSNLPSKIPSAPSRDDTPPSIVPSKSSSNLPSKSPSNLPSKTSSAPSRVDNDDSLSEILDIFQSLLDFLLAFFEFFNLR